MINNYFPANLENFSELQKEFETKHQKFYETPTIAAKDIAWSKENFGGLYDLITSEFKKRKAIIIKTRLFITPPGQGLPCHVDGHTIDHNYFSLNIPLRVSEDNHYHEWYSYDGEFSSMSSSVYNNYLDLLDPSRLKLIDRIVLNRPYFVKLGIIHRVINESDKPRLILKIWYAVDNNIEFMKSFS